MGESSSAPSVPGPRAYRACSTKGHSEEDLKGEGSERSGPDPKPQRQTHNGPEDAEGPAAWTHSLAWSEEGRRCAGRDAGAGRASPAGWHEEECGVGAVSAQEAVRGGSCRTESDGREQRIQAEPRPWRSRQTWGPWQ